MGVSEHASSYFHKVSVVSLRLAGCASLPVQGESSGAMQIHTFCHTFSSLSFVCTFSGGMREQEMREIKLHGVTKLGLKNIIDFIYTSKVSLDMGNLQDTLEAANFLQVMPVLRFCNQLLSSEVSSSSFSLRSLLFLQSFINLLIIFRYAGGRAHKLPNPSQCFSVLPSHPFSGSEHNMTLEVNYCCE